MKNKEIAEMFADGLTNGKTNHLFIDNDTIYSYGYHFPIAKRIGDGMFKFTTRGYSNTTARHKGLVKRAIDKKGYQIIMEELK